MTVIEDTPTQPPKHPGGRPLKFQSVEELQEKIDDYFTVTPKTEWTWTGLAMHLDTSRETLREYQEREEFVDPLKRALLKVENQYELDTRQHGRAGSIFALKNFGWKDKTEVDTNISGQLDTGIQDPKLAAGFTEYMKGK